ncbi:hypothetical protein SKM54_05685 [Acinetobacter faecalis]|uniref:hypothetical protein n=1 Tax=Acinetobacter faecalis TaxID=2665161 RepID=UPI002A90B6DD|nr:hypothetical protein [Acinetobacter faecalis]MDY6481936.1 hypothetical protein [Acinetobacter faecalis]
MVKINRNKIELLASANWSRISWKLSWEPIIKLDELLPRVGERYQISLKDSEARHTENGRYYLLWLPPHSELNTLYDRPTEVLKSCVIEAELSQGEWITDGHSFGAERIFSATIISIRKFFDYLPEIQVIQRERISHYFEFHHRIEFFKWDNFFLFIIDDEYKNTELLFNIDQGNYYLIFVNDWLSYSYDSYICKYLLDAQQIEFLKKYMIESNKLTSCTEDLEEEHLVQGALYM